MLDIETAIEDLSSPLAGIDTVLLEVESNNAYMSAVPSGRQHFTFSVALFPTMSSVKGIVNFTHAVVPGFSVVIMIDLFPLKLQSEDRVKTGITVPFLYSVSTVIESFTSPPLHWFIE